MRVFVVAALMCAFAAQAAESRFAALDIYTETIEPLAAFQFELTERHGVMQVVGIENGDNPGFAHAPYYDRDAVQQGSADRIVVASYSLADRSVLPRGRERIATVHVRLRGAIAPEFNLKLIAATDSDGRAIDAAIRYSISTEDKQ